MIQGDPKQEIHNGMAFKPELINKRYFEAYHYKNGREESNTPYLWVPVNCRFHVGVLFCQLGMYTPHYAEGRFTFAF